MKIRNGFVSNSSSTSFCVMGVTKESYTLNNFFETDDFYEVLEDSGVDYCSMDTNHDCIAIGLNIESMSEEETLREFRERARKLLETIDIVNEEINLHYGGYYDG
jgi:hypothetical protein